METKYLIIGNGIAGLSAAKEIRVNDPDGRIIMVTSEPYLTYYRVKLTEILSQEINESSLLVNKENWYEDNKIEVLLNKTVKKIDTDNNYVILFDDSIINYNKLLIATGSHPFIPPIKGRDKNGVFALRTIKDVEEVQFYCIQCETFSVIGGGLLGLEAAWSLKKLGKKVNVLEYSSYLLNRQLDEELGSKLKNKLVKEGIKVYTGSRIMEIEGVANVTGIIVNDGEVIKTDGVLISSGVRPNLSIIADSPILYDKGIIVDKHLKTNMDNVYAAGDVVEINGMVAGLWTTSNEQGRIAGANMSGKDLEYSYPKLFSTLRIGDIQVFSAGNITDYDQVYEYKDDEKEVHHKIFVKARNIVGAILFGDLKEMNVLRNAVFKHTTIDDYLSNGLSFKLK